MSSLFNSLRFRLLLLVLLCTIPALGLTFYSGLEQRRAAADGAKDDALRITRQVANQQNLLIEKSRQSLTTLSLLSQIRYGDPEECNSFLQTLIKDYPDGLTLFVSSLDGTVYCSTYPDIALTNIASRSYFQRAIQTNDFQIGGFEYDTETVKSVLPVAYPVVDETGNLRSVLITHIQMDWLDEMAPQTMLQEGSSINIFLANGEIMARYPNPEQWVGRMFPNAPLVQAVILKNGEGTTEEIGLDGVRRLFAFSSLSGLPQDGVYVSVGIPTQIAYQEVNLNLVRNLGSMVLVAVLAIILAWFSSDVFILQQVNALLQATRRLMAGELQARAPVFNDNAELSQLATSFNKMAETLESRDHELRQAEARYRTLIEQIPAITYTTTLDGQNHMQFISPQVEDMLGFLPDEWVSEPGMWKKRLHPDDRQRVMDELEASRRAQNPFQAEYRLLARNGSPIWVHDESLVIYDRNSEAVSIQGIMTDISERKRTEAELQSYALRLERSNRELQDFAYIASHDLQEPLRKIQAFGERLEVRYSSQLESDAKDYLQRMRSSAARLQNLINDLLTYSRVTSRGQSYQRVNLNVIANEVVSDLAEKINETRAVVQIDNLGEIDADPTQMRQLMQNLLGNGLKFHRPDTAPLVTVSGNLVPGEGNGTKESCLQLVIEDNGIGFDLKYLGRIFQPFQRLHGRGEYEGSGIGLAICRKIAERHRGSITAESIPGKGSKFIVKLPVNQTERALEE